MPPTLLLFAHPALEKSRVHRRLLERLTGLPGLTVNDLYEAYPDFDIDVRREQALLTDHDLILLQHPFYWYSVPALLKQWQDLVLEHGWAYGTGATALQGKRVASIITSGGGTAAYTREGLNRFTVRELLAPVEQTVRLCGMEYLPPYLIQGTHRMTEPDIEAAADRYRRVIQLLCEGRVDLEIWRRADSLNAVVTPMSGAGAGR